MSSFLSFTWGLPPQASTAAPAIDFGIGLLHWVMLVMFLVWGSFMAWCLVAYRARPGHRAQYAEPNHLTAIIPDALVVVFEVVFIFAYALPQWAVFKQRPPREAEATVIRVVAEQFAWNVHYAGRDGAFGRTATALVDMNNPLGLDHDDPAAADDVTAVNEVHAPLGKPVLLYLTSKDVIHSFFVPEFRVKQDAVPGLRLPLWFEPTVPGTYEIGCAQLCGIAHYAMRGDFTVDDPKAFDAWLKARAKAAR